MTSANPKRRFIARMESLGSRVTAVCVTSLLLLNAAPQTFAAAPSAVSGAPPGDEIITSILASGMAPAPAMEARGDESRGPFKRLIITNATLVNGTGAPPQGPVRIEIENDRIVAIRSAGTGSMAISADSVEAGVEVIDAQGHMVLPGFIDSHEHFGTPSHAFAGALTDPNYVGKLLLAHGITTVRDAGSLMGLGWTVDLKKRSDNGEISAPRIKAHALLPEGVTDPEATRRWVRAVHKRGADGLKFLGGAPQVIEAAIDEARRLGMKTMFHHAQTAVTRMNVLDTSAWGLDSMEHWYGLPEAMFEQQRVQDYPADYNYNNEQHRFAQAGRLWAQAAEPGSARWRSVIDTLIARDFTLSPTMTIYEANRDVMRARTAEWMQDYVPPYMARAFEPNPNIHGAFHFDWTTADEVAWKDNYVRWMRFLNDYKNAGGRVTVGADSGFIYGVYGFGYIRELELLQEAGFHPLEVIQSATLHGAQLLGIAEQTGSIEVGKKADLVIVAENPLQNFKVLYATGHRKLNPETGTLERTQGIRYTIKDGIVFDVETLKQQVKALVTDSKATDPGMP